MLAGQGKRNAVLTQVIAERNFAAKAVAAGRQTHLIKVILFRLHQHRHIQPGQTQRFGNGLFVTKVRQQHHNAVNRFAMLTKQRSTGFGLLPRLDAAQIGLGFIQHDRINVHLFKQRNRLLARLAHQIAGKKSPVANNDAEG